MASDQREQRDDIDEKMRLEGLFLPFVLAAFATERSLFGRRIREFGMTPREDEILEIWKPVMRQHMLDVGSFFKTPIGNDVQDNILDIAVADAMEARAEQQSQAISNTSKRNMDKAVQTAYMAFQEQGEDFTNAALATVGLRFLTRSQLGRDTGIVVTSTQSAAETSKNISATATGKRKKTWVTMGDERVRLTHSIADGQTVDENEPFRVGASLLKYPGDTSLGASLDEIVNCRCSAVYE